MRNLRLLLAAFLASTLLAPTLVAPIAASAASAPGLVSLDPSQKIHPLLQYEMHSDPTALVRVIVQKTHATDDAKKILSNVLGARLVEEFKLVPAFVAVVPQVAVPLIAADPTVRYIAPDGAVNILPDLSAKGLKPAPNPQRPKPTPEDKSPISAANLLTSYPVDTRATSVWSGATGHAYTGAGT